MSSVALKTPAEVNQKCQEKDPTPYVEFRILTVEM